MKTALAFLFLCSPALAAWPANQALVYVSPNGTPCPACKVEYQDLKALRSEHGFTLGIDGLHEGARACDFVVRSSARGPWPRIIYFDATGKAIAAHVGYAYTKPPQERLAEAEKIIALHPKFRKVPPPAPPVQEASLEVETADLKLVDVEPSSEVQGADVQQTQFGVLAAGCGSPGGGGGDFFTPPQSYALPYAGGGCSAPSVQSYAVPYDAPSCSGGGSVGGGDFFTPPQSYYVPQYVQPQYVVRSYVPQYYVARATTPYVGSGGINNFSLLNIQPQLSLFGGGLFGSGGLFGQRAYYYPASYSSRRVVCGPNGCMVY